MDEQPPKLEPSGGNERLLIIGQLLNGKLTEAEAQEKLSPNRWDVTQESRGLGDTIAKGIHKATFGLVEPCGGCKERQAKLNNLLPYRRAD